MINIEVYTSINFLASQKEAKAIEFREKYKKTPSTTSHL